jgi:small-conductance mechanosensitive channel
MIAKLINILAVILIFWLASYVITILSGIFKKGFKDEMLASKIMRAAKLPLRFLAILLGVYFSLRFTGIDWSWKKFSLDSLFYILIVLLSCYTASRLLKAFFVWHSSRVKSSDINQTILIFIRKAISVFLYVIGFLIIFQRIGVEIGPLLAGLGVVGIAVALGLQETLANVFGATFFLLDKTFKIGDYIQLDDGTKGNIEDISWRSTKIRTIEGNTVILPNSKFVNQKISSYDYNDPSYYIYVNLGVGYDSDLDLVERVSIRSAQTVLETFKIRSETEPYIRFMEFGDSAINLRIVVRVTRFTDERRVRSAIIKEIIREFRKEGIEIPFKQIVVHKTSN